MEENSYVDGPLPARCFAAVWLDRCLHMSGLSMRSHMNAGQDGFRDTGSKQRCDPREGPLSLSEGPESWIDHTICSSSCKQLVAGFDGSRRGLL
jgi:hypothetical protein